MLIPLRPLVASEYFVQNVWVPSVGNSRWVVRRSLSDGGGGWLFGGLRTYVCTRKMRISRAGKFEPFGNGNYPFHGLSLLWFEKFSRLIPYTGKSGLFSA